MAKSVPMVARTIGQNELMRESVIERKLVDAIKKRGGMCMKFISPGLNGVPDRIVLLPSGVMVFVETKATGKKMRPIQKRRKRQFENLGFEVYCIDEIKQIDEMLKEIGGDV